MLIRLMLSICLCLSLSAESHLEQVHAHLVDYAEGKESRVFIDKHRELAVRALRDLIHGVTEYRELQTTEQLNLIVALDPEHCIADLIYVALTDTYAPYQNHAIKLMVSLGDDDCLPFLYSCLRPNDVRAVAALKAIRYFKNADYSHVVALLGHKRSSFQGNDAGEEAGYPSYDAVMAECMETLAWSCDKKYIPILRKIASEKDEARSVPAKAALYRLLVLFADNRDEQLKDLLGRKGFEEWVRGVVKRESIEGILPEEE